MALIRSTYAVAIFALITNWLYTHYTLVPILVVYLIMILFCKLFMESWTDSAILAIVVGVFPIIFAVLLRSPGSHRLTAAIVFFTTFVMSMTSEKRDIYIAHIIKIYKTFK